MDGRRRQRHLHEPYRRRPGLRHGSSFPGERSRQRVGLRGRVERAPPRPSPGRRPLAGLPSSAPPPTRSLCPEDVATTTLVGSVSATDPNEDAVTYTITAGNEDGKLDIGPTSGAITVAAALDYETTPSYTLSVKASDADGNSAAATVDIAVTDVSTISLRRLGTSMFRFPPGPSRSRGTRLRARPTTSRSSARAGPAGPGRAPGRPRLRC